MRFPPFAAPPVSKWDEVEEYRKKVLAGPAKSRRVADKLAANGLVDPAADGGAAAALRLALIEEERARRILAQTRGRDDPLVISKDRGDRTVRGVSTIMAIHLHELFGEHPRSLPRSDWVRMSAGKWSDQLVEKALASDIKDLRCVLSKLIKHSSQSD